ncbi:MAG: hypothetical protein AAF413_00135 [Patescibacteria group bacterium]
MIAGFAQIVLERPDSLPQISTGSAQETVSDVLTLAFSVLGALSVLMITLQGMRYALSGGDPGKTSQAKNGIIYAGVGMAVAIFGFAITRFALGEVITVDGDAPTLVGRIAGLIAVATGIISVIMIVVGGIRYVLSDGDPAKTSSARQTIIYALVGAVIATFAAPIVAYMVERITETPSAESETTYMTRPAENQRIWYS